MTRSKDPRTSNPQPKHPAHCPPVGCTRSRLCPVGKKPMWSWESSGSVDAHSALCSSSLCLARSPSGSPAFRHVLCKSNGALGLMCSVAVSVWVFVQVFDLLCPYFLGAGMVPRASGLPSCFCPGFLRTRRGRWERPRLSTSSASATLSANSEESCFCGSVVLFAISTDAAYGIPRVSYTQAQD